MGFNPENIEEWSMGEYEKAKYSPISGNSNASNLQLYIPKLMPQINFGVPKVVPLPINKSILVNDEECKPTISTTINTQNYKTVPRTNNRKFGRIELKQGAEVQVEVKDKNPDTMYVSTKIDNSSGDVVTETYTAKTNQSTKHGPGTITLHGLPFMPGPPTTVTVDMTDLGFESIYSDQNVNPM